MNNTGPCCRALTDNIVNRNCIAIHSCYRTNGKTRRNYISFSCSLNNTNNIRYSHHHYSNNRVARTAIVQISDLTRGKRTIPNTDIIDQTIIRQPPGSGSINTHLKAGNMAIIDSAG